MCGGVRLQVWREFRSPSNLHYSYPWLSSCPASLYLLADISMAKVDFDAKTANIWTARIIPLFLIGIVGYVSWVTVEVLGGEKSTLTVEVR